MAKKGRTTEVRNSKKVRRRAPVSKGRTGYAPVNGLEMYYEIHGSGHPLVLLHGGAGGTDMFQEILPVLGRGRQIIATDLQAHGRTADIPRPLSYERMADDVASLLQHLRVPKADLMGYSLGAGVALRTTVQHPEVVRKLVVVSSPFRRVGWYPEVLQAQQSGPEHLEELKETPMYQNYARVAPRPEDWPVLMRKLAELLRQDYDWTDDVRRIQVPTLLVAGDADSVQTADMVRFFELLGGGLVDAGWDGSKVPRARLAILPGVTHYNIFRSPMLGPLVTSFLDAPGL
jgi:pimeloyl-ACP methyl ester carboxylesterase